MSNFIESAARWLSDPFGRTEFVKHDRITERMIETRERSGKLLDYHSRNRFPIAATVGNPRLRGRDSYARN